MPLPKQLLGLMVVACMQMTAAAQQAKYADVATGYHAEVAGITGNLLHVWSASAESSGRNPRRISLRLQVFSADMHLVTEKQVDLGEINSWYINFSHEKDSYYANIVCRSAFNKRIMLKVNADGNYTDVSEIPFPAGTNNMDERNPFAAIFRKNNSLFSVMIGNAKLNSTDSIAFLPGNRPAPGDIYQRILIRKTDFNTGKFTQCVLGSGDKRFYHPVLTVTDTAVLLSAVSEEVSQKKHNYSSLLLLARLDTNVMQTCVNNLVVQPTRNIKNEIYSPLDIVETRNGVFVISKGLYRKETVTFRNETQNGYSIPVPSSFSSYITNSLKITLINEKNNWLKDTIIETNGNNRNLLLDNLYTIPSGNGIDLFVSKKFSGSKQGVTHFSINDTWEVKDEDMMVDIRYDYLMTKTKNISPGVLLVPFARNWRRGLMKLEYEPVQ